MTITDLQNRAYTPYSGQPVVAVAETASGECFPGVRVENVTYPLTISAAQSALFCCLSEGFSPRTLYLEDSIDSASTAFWRETYSLEIAPLETTSDLSFTRVLKQVNSVEKKLRSLLDEAIADESDFPVSALLKTSQGFISGVNIEATNWNAGLCAERVALAKAISYGLNDFEALYVCTRKGEFSSPCGACRQVIMEHMPHNAIHLYHADGTTSPFFSSDLLPYSFQSFSLQKQHKHQ
ncbi:MAG TPA: cytidine deaminase [Balneolaceae bacterium]|nr:cytidine deaminase [Balneolaceae bacterium]